LHGANFRIADRAQLQEYVGFARSGTRWPPFGDSMRTEYGIQHTGIPFVLTDQDPGLS
jgi:hypothetical protein